VIDVGRVAAWLGREIEVEGQASTGASNVTWLVRVDGEPAVLRHPPPGDRLPTAHDLAREHRFLGALQDTAVPVPAVIAFCDDAGVAGVPFLLVGRVDGVCLLGPEPADLDAPALARGAVDVLAALHALDPVARGLSAPPGRYLERQLVRWHNQLERTPTAVRLGDLASIDEWLRAHLPAHEDVTIVHGDYGFHNLLVRRDRITAVLDWELATVGDPLADVTAFLKSWGASALSPNPANDAVALRPGAPTRDELLDRYERATGRSFAPNRAFYDVFGVWKSIGILEGVHARSGGARFADEVPQLVARARAMTA